MRTIHTHETNDTNKMLVVEVIDEPGAGGACHHYRVRPHDIAASDWSQHIEFQNGPINEAGVNGLTQEALLAIVADRLHCFQMGPFACRENADALDHVKAAMVRLHDRTRARMDRNVEGTNQV